LAADLTRCDKEVTFESLLMDTSTQSIEFIAPASTLRDIQSDVYMEQQMIASEVQMAMMISECVRESLHPMPPPMKDSQNVKVASVPPTPGLAYLGINVELEQQPWNLSCICVVHELDLLHVSAVFQSLLTTEQAPPLELSVEGESMHQTLEASITEISSCRAAVTIFDVADQPQAPYTYVVDEGATAVISVELNEQLSASEIEWIKDGVDRVTFDTNIRSAATAVELEHTLTLEDVQMSQTGVYSVRVRNVLLPVAQVHTL
jgi:hypothetical protein